MTRKRKKNVDVFTTSDVARICKVSPRIVTKWFDDNKLEGYRLPSSKHRRFEKEKLEKFMQDYGFPMRYLEEEVQARTEPLEEVTTSTPTEEIRAETSTEA